MSYSSILNSTLSPKNFKAKNYLIKEKQDYSPHVTEKLEISPRCPLQSNTKNKNKKDQKKGAQTARDTSNTITND